MRKEKSKKAYRKESRKGRKKVFPEFVGRAQMTRDGFILVKVEGQDDNVFVKSSKTRHALDGDLVRIAVTRSATGGKRREGEVVEIVERSRRQFVGILHIAGGSGWVLMQSKSMPYDIEVDMDQVLASGAQKGMKVAAVVDRWSRGDINPIGHIVDVLGMPGENDTEMHAILAEYNLPYRFEKEVEDAADAISEKITAEDIKGRKDFRDTFTFTIDPSDAKDFDDALSFRKLTNGNYEIGVHIADVSYYVKPGSAVDKEARERGTSVYLVDRTVPMLPEKLCNKLCSLRPDEDKLCFSVVFEVSPKAEIKSRWIGRTVIRSNHRLDYDQAQLIIEAGQKENPSELEDAIFRLHCVASVIREKRFREGAINFDRPEMKVVVDENGKPVDVYEKISKEANWLIEEYMLLANRTVAEFVSKSKKTFIYRIHAEPNYEKLEGLRIFASGFGYRMGEATSGKTAAESLRVLLAESKDKPEYDAFENLALRSMSKAVYSTDNIGHYGLAFKDYTHFTSPIRRYPDTMVHRLLAAYLDGAAGRNKEQFQEECIHASERELVAADAERASVKYKMIEYMQDKVGMEYDGAVSGLTEWGMYVEIEPTHIEGMIPLREIRADFFDYDEAHCCLVGRRTGKTYRLGDRLRIKVRNANLEQRLLDYELVEPNS